MEFKKPDCSDWRIWEGREIEGTTDLGMKTLFVRYGDPIPYLTSYDRVWFCKEFLRSENYEEVIQHTLLTVPAVCIEVEIEDLKFITPRISKAQLYLKIEAKLKEGDHVCIGTAFKDEAFMIGSGARVEPSQYANDVRIE